jgi:hypothetical protein
LKEGDVELLIEEITRVRNHPDLWQKYGDD